MKNSIMVIGLVSVIGVVKVWKSGSPNKRKESEVLNAISRDKYCGVMEISRKCGLSGFETMEALKNLKKKGLVYESHNTFIRK